jgi:hypothetical protein
MTTDLFIAYRQVTHSQNLQMYPFVITIHYSGSNVDIFTSFIQIPKAFHHVLGTFKRNPFLHREVCSVISDNVLVL